MIAYILKVSLCWLFFYGIFELFLKKRTFFKANRSYLLITMLIGILLPFLEFIPYKNESNVAAIIYPVLMEIDDLQAVVDNRAGANFDWMFMLTIIYSIGFLIAFVRFTLGISKILGLYKRSEKLENPNYTLVITNKSHLPFSFFRWVFFSKKMKFTDEMEQVLLHEIEHIKGKHSFDVLISEFLKVVFWCSPLIYLYKKALKEVHEYLADHTVIKNSDKISYKKLLLSQTNNGLQMALTHQFFNSQLKNRLTMINQKRSGRPTLVMYALGIPVLLLLLYAFTYAFDRNDLSAQENANYYSDDGNVPDIIKNISKYYMETDPANVPYFQIEGKDIELPLFKHISLYETFGNATVLLPENAVKLFGEKAKLGYINFENVNLKYGPSKYELSLRDNHLMQILRDNMKLASEKYPKPKSAKKNVPSAGKNMQTRLLAGLKDTIPLHKYQSQKAVGEVFKEVDIIPYFPGCENITGKEKLTCSNRALFNYMIEHLEYPKKARELGLTGSVNIQFVVTKDGAIADTKIIRDIGGDCGFAALEVFNGMNENNIRWNPGIKDGKAVNTMFMMPVRFDLTADEKEKAFKNNPALHETIQLNDEIFKVVEQMPRFPGCEDLGKESEKDNCSKQKMIDFIYNNVKYPQSAREKGIEGTTVVQFVVRSTGEISDIKLVRDLGGGTGGEAVKAVEAMQTMDEKWTPGYQRGKAVNVQYTLPVKFKLDSKKKPEQVEKMSDLLYNKSTFSCKGLIIKEDTDGFNAKGKGFNFAADYNSPKDYPLVYVDGKKWNSALSDVDLSKMESITYYYPREKKDHGFVIKFESRKPESNNLWIGSNDQKKAQPLFILNDEVYESELKEIDPEDIESINVLKGESAITKYGDKAINGVVEIITKRYSKKLKKQDRKLQKVKEPSIQVEPAVTVCDHIEDAAEKEKCKQEKIAIAKNALENLDFENNNRSILEIEKFSAYPNPANEFVNVSFKGTNEPTLVQLFNIDGQVISNEMLVPNNGLFETKIYIGEIEAKLILLRIEQNGKYVTKKIAVE
jgi:TonB family protein